jgi:hypothetical protein
MTHAALISEPRIVPITPSADAPRAMSSDILRNAHAALAARGDGRPHHFVLLDEVGCVAHERALMPNESLQEFDWSI